MRLLLLSVLVVSVFGAEKKPKKKVDLKKKGTKKLPKPKKQGPKSHYGEYYGEYYGDESYTDEYSGPEYPETIDLYEYPV